MDLLGNMGFLLAGSKGQVCRLSFISIMIDN